MKTRNGVILAVLLGWGIVCGADPASAYYWGYVADTPNEEILLTEDLVNSAHATGPAIRVTARGVSILLCEHAIDGDGYGSGILIEASDCLVDNGFIRNTAGAAVVVNALADPDGVVSGITLTRLEISACGALEHAAVRFRGEVQGPILDSCSIHDCPEGAILAGEATFTEGGTTYFQMSSTEVRGNGAGPAGTGPANPEYVGTVSLCPGNNAFISGNRLLGNADVLDGTPHPSGVPGLNGYAALYFCNDTVGAIVNGNDIIDNPYGGVQMENAVDVSIIANNLQGNGCGNAADLNYGEDQANSPFAKTDTNWWGSDRGPELGNCADGTSGIIRSMDGEPYYAFFENPVYYYPQGMETCTLPAQPSACCVGGTCEILTFTECRNQDGAWMGEGETCYPGICAGGLEPPKWACCFPDGSCEELYQFNCDSLNGVYHPDKACADVACPVLTGACCHPDGTCTDGSEADCPSPGVFKGYDTECDTTVCPQPELTVRIDLEPNNAKNCINTGSKMNVRLAILSDATFDATTVDPTTIKMFAGPGVSPTLPSRSVIVDVNYDGRPDMMLYMRGRDIDPDCDSSIMTLTGETFDGQRVTGQDKVCWLGPACP